MGFFGATKQGLQALGLLEPVRTCRDWVRKVTNPARFQIERALCMMTGASGGIPIPPLRVLRFVGPGHPKPFLRNGKFTPESIQSILERNGLLLREMGDVLDFGCGCGRVLRHFASIARGRLHGTDYNPILIDWCKRHLPFASFMSNGLTPPLPCEADRFDLVYAVSVFTHLPSDTQFEWMRELQRVLKPGGHLLFSTHGEKHTAFLDPAELDGFRCGHLIVKDAAHAGENRCIAYHPYAYVKDKLAVGFDLIDFAAGAAKGTNHQDIYLLRKQGTVSIDASRSSETVAHANLA